jgi:hypothetical protein
MVPGMRNSDFLRRNGLVLATLLPLGGALFGCGADAASPGDTRSEKDVPVEDDDESSAKTSENAEGEGPHGKPIDAAVGAGRKDAGSTAAFGKDAGGAKLDAATPGADAAVLPTDAATTPLDARSTPTPADASVDTGVAPTPSRDAATPADAQVPGALPHTFKVDSKAEWTASGFKVEAGHCYTIEATIDDKWLDLDVPADLSGWKDKKDARISLFAPFRRVAQADIGFYQFATCVNKKTDQCFPVLASSTVCPKIAGELFFFVNDVAGFETNNVGTATVSIRAK